MLHDKIIKTIKFLLIGLLVFNLCSCRTFETDVHIFSNIEECQSIEGLNDNNTDLKIYFSPDKDKNLRNLQFQEFFGCDYTSEDLIFELFAYEFSSVDIAMSYFKNFTGKEDDPNPTFCDSSGVFWFKRIVVKENKAYAVRCKKDYKDKMIELINSCFKEEITKT